MIAPLLVAAVTSIVSYNNNIGDFTNGMTMRSSRKGFEMSVDSQCSLDSSGSDDFVYTYGYVVLPKLSKRVIGYVHFSLDEINITIDPDIYNSYESFSYYNDTIDGYVNFKYCYSLNNQGYISSLYMFSFYYYDYSSLPIVVYWDSIGGVVNDTQWDNFSCWALNSDEIINFDNSNLILSGKRNAQANNIIDGITEPLSLTRDLASNFLDGFTKLFYDNNQLTNLAWFSLVLLGIAILFGMVNLSMNLIGKNTGVK